MTNACGCIFSGAGLPLLIKYDSRLKGAVEGPVGEVLDVRFCLFAFATLSSLLTPGCSGQKRIYHSGTAVARGAGLGHHVGANPAVVCDFRPQPAGLPHSVRQRPVRGRDRVCAPAARLLVFRSDLRPRYSREEVLGRNCRFLQGPDTDRRAVREIREAIDSCTECTVRLLNYTKSGQPFWVRCPNSKLDTLTSAFRTCLGSRPSWDWMENPSSSSASRST